jgi:hypothetical protein
VLLIAVPVLVLLLGGLIAMVNRAGAEEQIRVDRFDLRSNREGHILVDPKTGRVDVFDRFSNRQGYGHLRNDRQTIDLYSPKSERVGTGVISPPKK